MIPYGRQNIDQNDIESVVSVLKSDFITQGPIVPKFEEAVRGFCRARFSLAVNSATSALHLALLALDIKKGDLVWTSPISFVASANCVLYCGADIDFVDIDPKTFNISVQHLEEKLLSAANSGKLPSALVCVHMAGFSCDMHKIHGLCKLYGVRVIEDASHAIGAKFKGSHVGSCEYSDITVFSFHPVKIITTGEGGMLLTNTKQIAEKVEMFRSHGITRNPEKMSKNDGGWYYEQLCLGYNYRLTDIQAALGLSQLNKLRFFIKKRNSIAKFYDEALSNLPIELPPQDPDISSAHHLYIIRLKLESLKTKTRKEVYDFLRQRKIGVNIHYIPIHLQPFYKKIGFKLGDFPNSENYYRRAISIPIYPDLMHSELEFISTTIKESLL